MTPCLWNHIESACDDEKKYFSFNKTFAEKSLLESTKMEFDFKT